MRQRWAILGYAACVVAVLGGLGWVTFHTLRLERMEVVARADARLQESIRLVLWRMDSTLTPIIAREAARPYFEYQPFYPADRAFTNTTTGREEREVLVPSPLLQAPDPFVWVYFQQDADVLTSPQVPTGGQRELAEDAYVTGYSVAAAQQRLTQLEALLSPGGVRGRVYGGADAGERDAGWAQVRRLAEEAATRQQTQQLQSAEPDAPGPQQAGRLQTAFDGEQVMLNDYQARQAVTDRAKNIGENKFKNNVQQRAGPPADPASVAAAQPVADKSVPPAVETSGAPPASKEAQTGQAPAAPGATPAAAVVAEGSGKDAKEDAKDADRERGAEGRADDELRKSVDKAAMLRAGIASGKENGPASEKTELDEIAAKHEAIGPSVTQGQFVARWMENPTGGEPELVFTRDVVVGERTLHQGFWLDWPGLRSMLLDSAKDLLPESGLQPVTDPARVVKDQAILGRTLAAIPAELVLPPAPAPLMPAWTPARTVIAVTWVAVLLAVIATGLVLRTSLELAERRGRFVSAVTHELRTPLTTFCLYSQMLADGMVKEEEAQKGYFNTLKSESQRLARIVESVLDYARLSGNRTTKSPISMTLADLIVPLRRPLAARCEQSGMTLDVEGDVLDSRLIRTDPAIVERVVYNLVDNACKYAAEGQDSRIHLEVSAGEREVALTVRDHGPGIDPGESARLFRPFVRGARHGHGSIPGLGLGLAIARGLSKELGGDLELVNGAPGAAFRLRLPRDGI